jgi:hypothetical protein
MPCHIYTESDAANGEEWIALFSLFIYFQKVGPDGQITSPDYTSRTRYFKFIDLNRILLGNKRRKRNQKPQYDPLYE